MKTFIILINTFILLAIISIMFNLFNYIQVKPEVDCNKNVYFYDLDKADAKEKKKKLFTKYPWLTKSLYLKINSHCYAHNVDLRLICALIHKESRGRNIISKKNRNGTRDYGLMQVNGVHSKTPRKFLNINNNLAFGINYFKRCLKKSGNDILVAIRLYNQGINGKAHRYKNWSYVENIYANYIGSN